MVEPRPSVQTLSSNIYELDDLVTYCKCPLRYRYKKWSGEEKVVDTREAIRIASRDAIRAYMGQGIGREATPRIALDRATATYKHTLLSFDSMGLFRGDANWLTHFNFGLVMIRKFHEKINHHTDRPIMGPKSCSYPIGDDVVHGDLDGFIAFNVESKSEIRFGIVTVSQRPTTRSTWERIAQGFAYGAFRQITGDLRQSPISVVNVDPYTKRIEEYEVGPEDRAEFESLAAVAINGIKHNVFVPQPVKANCRTCPYDKACQLKHAYPGENQWHKREFLAGNGS